MRLRSVIPLFLAVLAHAQTTITFSHQPLQSFQSLFGGKLAAVAMYSAEVCSVTGATVPGGVIRQQAELKGINVIDMSLNAPTATRALGRSMTYRIIDSFKWFSVGMSAMSAPLGLIQNANKELATKVTAYSATAAAVAQIIQVPLNSSQSQVQTAVNQTLAGMLDPKQSYNVPAKGCISGLGFFGEYIKAFVPVTVTLP